MKKEIKYKSGWFTPKKVRAILLAGSFSKGPGAEDRITFCEALREEALEAEKEASFTIKEISVGIVTLKRWVIGLKGAWEARDQQGQLILSDNECSAIIEAARALRCWNELSKLLPQVDVEEGFEEDPDFEDFADDGDEA